MPKNNPLKHPSFPRLAIVIGLLVIASVGKFLLDWRYGNLNLVAVLDHFLLVFLVALLVHLLDQYLMWKDGIKMNRTTLDELIREQNDLLNSVTETGVVSMYRSRFAARKAIRRDIANAKRRIWLLGVGLNVIIDLDKLIKELEDKKAKHGVDVRIMMLDAFRSTAVFRTFLESSPDIVGAMLQHYEEGPSDTREKLLYFTQRLCGKFEYICGRLRGSESLLGAVKFYAHTPTCWMVITDDEAYFQAYTFGSVAADGRKVFQEEVEVEFTEPDLETIGDLMPVIKFKDMADGSVFEVLTDHYRKLWSTSDEDLFHNLPRELNKVTLVEKIFSQRLTWLKHVNGALHSPRKPYQHEPYDFEGQKYRKFTRKICPTIVEVTLATKQGTPLTKKARIYDFSRYGLALEVSSEHGALKIEDVVIVEGIHTRRGSKASENEFLLTSFFTEEMLGPEHPYSIKHITGNRIGLQMLNTH